MENADFARVLREIADMLAAKRDNIFKIRAYRKAADSIEALAEPLTNLAREGRMREISGVGPAITKKISELASTGKLGFYERLKAESSGETTETKSGQQRKGAG